MEGDSSTPVRIIATWQTALTALAFAASLFCTVHPVYILPASFRGDAAADRGRPTPWSSRSEIFARVCRAVRSARLDLSTAPPLAVLLLLATNTITRADVLRGTLGSDGIRPLDVLVLVFCFSYISASVDLTGLYAHLALKVVKSSRGRSKRLLLGVAAFSWVLGVVSGNDVVVLIMTPICVYFSRSINVDPLPYLIAQFFAANNSSVVLVIGNLTNIIVVLSNNLNFLAYTAFFIGPAVVACITTYATLRLFFASRLSGNWLPCDASEKANLAHPRAAFCKCCGLLVCVVVLTVVNVASRGSVEIWMITVPFATAYFLADLVKDVVSERGCRDSAADSAARSETAAEHKDGAGSAEYAPAVNFCETAPPAGGESAEKLVAEPADSPATAPVSDVTFSGVSEVAQPGGVLQHSDPECTSRVLSGAGGSRPQQHPPPSSPLIACAGTSPSLQSLRFADAGSRFPTVGAVLSRVPWSLAPFALSMSVLVEAMHVQGWTSALARLLAPACFSVWSSVFVMGSVTVLGCQLANNVPATIFLARVVQSADFSVPPAAKRGALLALIYGSNVGANMMVHASLAGLMWMDVLRQKNYRMSNWTFAKWNTAILPAALFPGLAVVACQLTFDGFGRLLES